MKTQKKSGLFILVFLLFHANAIYGEVTPYPSVPGLTTSDLYTVEVNGRPMWTEKFVGGMDLDKLPDWFNAPYVRQPQEVHLVNFTGDEQLTVSITAPHAIGQAVVRPLSRGIEARIEGNRVIIPVQGPDQLAIEIDDLPPLFLFANPPEKSSPVPGDPNVHYFGPGVHLAGYLQLKDGETVYIAPGAIVYGGIRAEGASGIRVMGRGILDGNFEYRQMVKMENCRNVLVEGVIIRHSNGWTNTIINSDEVTYDWVKVLGFGPSSDGINPVGSRKFRITNCFLRCTDDCIAIKSPAPDHMVDHVLIANNTMIGFAYSDGVTIGFETNGKSIKKVTVKNCDILLARGGSRVDGHSGFSIICDGPTVISRILFEDIRVERSEIKLFELNITDGTKYDVNPPGHIRKIMLKNIDWLHEGPIAMQGFDANHRVEGVVFRNCRIAGRPLKNVQARTIRTNAFVRGIVVK